MASSYDTSDDDPEANASTSSSFRPSSSAATLPENTDDDGHGHGPVVPPLWFNDLIRHGFSGLLLIVTKNLSIATADFPEQQDHDDLTLAQSPLQESPPPPAAEHSHLKSPSAQPEALSSQTCKLFVLCPVVVLQ